MNFTNLILAKYCFQVPDPVLCSSLIINIDGQVKGAVGIVDFSWMVTSEFLVIMNWKTFIVCCLSGRITCLCITITTACLGSLSDFHIRNLLPVLPSFLRTMSPHYFKFSPFVLGKSKLSITNKLCAGARSCRVVEPRSLRAVELFDCKGMCDSRVVEL